MNRVEGRRTQAPRISRMTHVLTAAVVLLNVSGNYFLRRGMRSVGEVVSFSPLDYIRTFANIWVAVGVVFLVGWLISQLSLLSWADLSYVLPVTSISYILTTVVGAFALHERVEPGHWVAVGLIFTGAVIAGETTPRTGPRDPRHPGERP